MEEKRGQHTREYTVKAVRLLKESGRLKVQIARKSGIHDSLLTRWKAQMEYPAGEVFPG